MEFMRRCNTSTPLIGGFLLPILSQKMPIIAPKIAIIATTAIIQTYTGRGFQGKIAKKRFFIRNNNFISLYINMLIFLYTYTALLQLLQLSLIINELQWY